MAEQLAEDAGLRLRELVDDGLFTGIGRPRTGATPAISDWRPFRLIVGLLEHADLPSIDRRFAGRPYRHGWRVETRPATDDVDLAGAVHVDAHTGAETRWDPGPQFSSGEWLFVPTGPAEAEGVVMTYVQDRTTGISSLVVLDARDVGAGPIARISLPQRVPYGFHATWVPAAAV